MEPLIAGLRIYLGETPQVAKEIFEIGQDVAERIRVMSLGPQGHQRVHPHSAEGRNGAGGDGRGEQDGSDGGEGGRVGGTDLEELRR